VVDAAEDTVSWEQLWYTVCGLLALAGARLLDRWLPPAHGNASTTVVVTTPPSDEESSGRHRRHRDEE
jgi:hypothetical protein